MGDKGASSKKSGAAGSERENQIWSNKSNVTVGELEKAYEEASYIDSRVNSPIYT